jgi:multisubunit Na+/H+ antiporter MnhB subunit
MYGEYAKYGPHSYSSLPAWKHALILGINGLGFSGGVLIAYGIGVVLTGNTYAPFERYASRVADILTLVGVLLTAVSIYGEPNLRPPDSFSRHISAPLVILATAFTMWLILFSIVTVPAHVVNGFALLGLAGGLFRTISRA